MTSEMKTTVERHNQMPPLLDSGPFIFLFRIFSFPLAPGCSLLPSVFSSFPGYYYYTYYLLFFQLSFLRCGACRNMDVQRKSRTTGTGGTERAARNSGRNHPGFGNPPRIGVSNDHIRCKTSARYAQPHARSPHAHGKRTPDRLYRLFSVLHKPLPASSASKVGRFYLSACPRHSAPNKNQAANHSFFGGSA